MFDLAHFSGKVWINLNKLYAPPLELSYWSYNIIKFNSRLQSCKYLSLFNSVIWLTEFFNLSKIWIIKTWRTGLSTEGIIGMKILKWGKRIFPLLNWRWERLTDLRKVAKNISGRDRSVSSLFDHGTSFFHLLATTIIYTNINFSKGWHRVLSNSLFFSFFSNNNNESFWIFFFSLFFYWTHMPSKLINKETIN